AGLWKSVMQPYYESETTEIVSLANLHGDALEYSEQVRWLQQFASYRMLGKACLRHGMVDPVDTESNDIIIETRDLMKDETLEKSLKLAEGLDCAESQHVIDLVRNKTCLNTKQMMQLQK
ncbi:11325_t:CDS:2, partial [Ambispora gerdemannii]